MGFRGGGQIDPPQRILVFKYPSGDRVNSLSRKKTINSLSRKKTTNSLSRKKTINSLPRKEYLTVCKEKNS